LLTRCGIQELFNMKVGVMLLDLLKADQVQERLFEASDSVGSQARMRANAALNARFGQDTVTWGGRGS
jgi:hypothetical protein